MTSLTILVGVACAFVSNITMLLVILKRKDG